MPESWIPAGAGFWFPLSVPVYYTAGGPQSFAKPFPLNSLLHLQRVSPIVGIRSYAPDLRLRQTLIEFVALSQTVAQSDKMLRSTNKFVAKFVATLNRAPPVHYFCRAVFRHENRSHADKISSFSA